MSETSGKVDFRVGQETYQTWYKIIGNLHSSVRPAIVIHGGPGLSHHYMLPFTELYTRFDIPVIFYDQIGIGESSHPKGVGADFWTPQLWMDELDNLVEKLGIENFDALGHSWGAMLLAQYAGYRHPRGLRRIALMSGSPSMDLWIESVRGLLAQMPAEVKETVEKYEKEGKTDHPAYKEAMNVFYAKHVCQLSPWPEEMNRSFAALEEDPTVYLTAIGPSELTIVGTLKDWSCLDKIHTITNTTLLTNGADDEAQDVCIRPFFSKIPKSRWVTFAKSSHMAFFEERDRCFSIVGNFLKED